MTEFLYQIQDGTFGYSKAATHVISVKCTPIHASVMYQPSRGENDIKILIPA
jgi:hypothetical protein